MKRMNWLVILRKKIRDWWKRNFRLLKIRIKLWRVCFILLSGFCRRMGIVSLDRYVDLGFYGVGIMVFLVN